MMMSRASSESALTISSIWHWAIDRAETGVSAAKSQPRRWSSGVTFRRSAARSMRRRGPARVGSRPMKTLAAASRLSKRFSSWCTKAMPAPSDWPTVREACSAPPITTVPAEGATTPPSTFMSVDLPAPFSPMSPTTSPGWTARLTPFSARTPG